MKRCVFIIFLFAVYFFVLTGSGTTEEISLTLNAGPFQMISDVKGFDDIIMDGFKDKAAPGDPMLPAKILHVLVPPDVDWDSLSLVVKEMDTAVIDGIYSLKPSPPFAAIGDPKRYFDRGKNVRIKDGKNQNIYETDAFYPDQPLKLLPYGRLRKWNFARIEFRPFQYNPVKGQLRLTKKVEIRLRFDRLKRAVDAKLLNDKVMDHMVPELFINYQEGKAWYHITQVIDTESASSYYDYVIIADTLTLSGSTKLMEFIRHKKMRGHSVLVVTEKEFSLKTGPAPNTKADKIRQWLIDNYISYGIQYVLFIGDPSPYEDTEGEGDIPMKMCWPRFGASWGVIEVPTDHYFADLTGDWDMDNDQRFGEYTDWDTAGGVDLAADVFVGRIPVYKNNYAQLDSILQKVMDYDNESDIAWRKNVLLPMSFLDEDFDSGKLGEQMIDDYFASQGFSTWTIYQQGNGACAVNDSDYASDEELFGGTVVRDRWVANDYGMVCWAGHGNSHTAYVGYDGCHDSPSSILMDFTYAQNLDDDHPSLVFQLSCENGYPELFYNLGMALLNNGSVGTTASSRSNYYSVDGTTDFNGDASSPGIAYEYMQRLAQGLSTAQSLYWGKWDVVTDIDSGMELVNQYDFNLYGDPSISYQNMMGLAEAVDNDTYAFLTGAGPDWIGQDTTNYYDGDAAQSGSVTHGETTNMWTTVTGPGTLYFNWKVSSEANFDFLEVYTDWQVGGPNTYNVRISGTVDWEQKSFVIPEGSHTILWAYTKDTTVDGGQDCGWVDKVIFCAGAPDIPERIFYPDSDSDGSYQISWLPSPGADNYMVSRATSPGSIFWLIVYNGPGTYFQESGKLNGSYYYRVTAINSCGNSSYIQSGAVQVCNQLLPPASINCPATDNDGNYTITWSSVQHADNYVLEEAINPSFLISTVVYNGPNTSFDLTNKAEGSYYYRVRAYSSCTSSQYNMDGYVYVCYYPDVPAFITYPSRDCDGSFQVSWSGVSGAQNYYLQRSPYADFSNLVATLYTGTNTYYNESGLTNGNYYYRVRAERTCGEGSWKTGEVILVTVSQTSPEMIDYPSTDDDGAFIVTWNQASGSTSYTLQRADNPSFSSETACYQGTSLEYHESGLRNGTYYYRVRANNACTSSMWLTGGPILVDTPINPVPWIYLLLLD